MTTDDLDNKFLEAVKTASNMSQSDLAQDVQLRLYALYKQATFGSLSFNHTDTDNLRSAFKANAWIQVSHLSSNEAKEKYINTINSLL